MKTKIHSLVIEGIVFCGSGLGLLSYSLSSFGKAFNKSWAQSPYLFPLIVSFALIGLSVWLIGEGLRASKGAGTAPDRDPGNGGAGAPKKTGRAAQETAAKPQETAAKSRETAAKSQETVLASDKIRGVAVVMVICVLYYAALAFLKIPYITVGILSFQYTFSTFEVVTLVFLGAMMGYMGVQKPAVLILVPVGTTLFLSIAFRALLHVLLP